jgi:tRNA uridine 5-carboxymethylaminomethyl modification enzyme
MFTSRAEFRLSLRADNADQRLTPLAMKLGCASEERSAVFLDKMEQMDKAMQLLSDVTWSPKEIAQVGIKINQDGTKRSGFQLLAFPDVVFEDLLSLQPNLAEVSDEIRRQVERDALYANYIARQQRDIDLLQKDEAHVIPADFHYGQIDGLSNELTSKLEKTAPTNLAQAARIDGMTPAALTLLLSHLKRDSRKKSA